MNRITRRDALRLGAGAIAGVLGTPAIAADGLISRPIPSSGERLPVIGIGTNRYRTGSESGVAPLRATLQAFVAAGGQLIDTAPMYGSSELVLGELIAGLGIRDRVFLATKVYANGREAGAEELNASFQRLQTERIDLVQVHNLSDTATQLATMREGKKAERYRYIGITTSSDSQYAEMETVMKRETLDFIQIDYSLDNRSANARILPLAIERRMAVLINLPFGRARLFSAVRGRPLPAWASEFDCSSWAQFFLKYVVSHPAVTVAIPGTRSAAHATDNMGAARGRLPDQALRAKMEQFFDAL